MNSKNYIKFIYLKNKKPLFSKPNEVFELTLIKLSKYTSECLSIFNGSNKSKLNSPVEPNVESDFSPLQILLMFSSHFSYLYTEHFIKLILFCIHLYI